LRTPAEFRRVREYARRGKSHPLLVVYMAPNEVGLTRVGITVSRKVGNAVVRNRVRRRLREAMRLRLPTLAPGMDLVIVGRPASANATWAELNAALDVVLPC
jgi:ribonuclease P protein component